MKQEIVFKSLNGKNGLNGNGHAAEKLNGFHLIGDDHVGTSMETPMRKDAFRLSDQEKMEIIEDRFRDIMETLGLDLTDDSLKGRRTGGQNVCSRNLFMA
jgi:GTP cyclohydrolase I